MPQLSPLSWLMLYVFFWVLVALLSSVVWWWGQSKLECPHTKVEETASWAWC